MKHQRLQRRRSGGVDEVLDAAAVDRKWRLLSQAMPANTKSRPSTSSHPEAIFTEQSEISNLTFDDVGSTHKNPCLTELSAISRDVLRMKYMTALRRLMVSVAVICLVYQLSHRTEHTRNNYDVIFTVANFFVDGYFIGEGLLHFLASYSRCLWPHSHPRHHFSLHRGLERLQWVGLLDVGVSVLVLVLGSGGRDYVLVAGWLRLLRLCLVAAYYFAESPHIMVLLVRSVLELQLVSLEDVCRDCVL